MKSPHSPSPRQRIRVCKQSDLQKEVSPERRKPVRLCVDASCESLGSRLWDSVFPMYAKHACLLVNVYLLNCRRLGPLSYGKRKTSWRSCVMAAAVLLPRLEPTATAARVYSGRQVLAERCLVCLPQGEARAFREPSRQPSETFRRQRARWHHLILRSQRACKAYPPPRGAT